ncbi:molecular chaperone DnaJ [Candidatus Woesearchaeota archaeon]|nr:molecular chaperone DnaJ [Candidatus Woesearchaeota archaeon]
MAEKDYYKVLGVPKGASKEDIKAAYKKLAKQHHPDLNKEEGAADKFKEINEAASVLGDEEKRKQYDQYGPDAFKYGGGQSGFGSQDFSGFDFSSFGGGFDFDSIFDTFFGGGGMGGGRRRARSNRGSDLAYELSVSLEDVSDGVKKKIKITKNDECAKCDGKGGSGEDTCTVCHGAGMYRETRRTPFGMFQTTAPCRNCQGSGSIFKHVCDDCQGTGRKRNTKTIEVNIPAGIMEGARLRMNGEGEAGYRGGPSGDLYIIIHVEPHDVFERDDDDLLSDVRISFVQAALGDKVKVPTLKGEASMRIPAGTQPGDVLRLKGEGLKHMHSFGRGDILFTMIVEVPRHLSRKQEKILKELEASLE